MRGFWFARPINGFDGVRPLPWQPRPWIEDIGERDEILTYLRSGAIVAPNRDVLIRDVFDLTRGRVVPMAFHTDGSWIWSDISTYHLQERGLAPEPDFLAHVTAHEYRCPVVEEDVREAAKEAYDEWVDLRRRQREEYERNRTREQTPFTLVRGELSNEPPTVPLDADQFEALVEGRYDRFSENTENALVAAGWMPGRDASARVDPWLDAFCAREAYGRKRHEIFPAARRILHEFGLLDIEQAGISAHGEPLMPVRFYPLDVWLDPWANDRFARRLGLRVFPIAQTEHSASDDHVADPCDDLLVDEAGRVYRFHVEHGWQLLGDDIDAALELLIHGRPPTNLNLRV